MSSVPGAKEDKDAPYMTSRSNVKPRVFELVFKGSQKKLSLTSPYAPAPTFHAPLVFKEREAPIFKIRNARLFSADSWARDPRPVTLASRCAFLLTGMREGGERIMWGRMSSKPSTLRSVLTVVGAVAEAIIRRLVGTR
jgi:hypothetical protein